jgi:hypothetical protein
VSKEDGSEIKYNGLLKKEDDRYRLTIETTSYVDTRIVADVIKQTLDEMDAYMRTETIFIMDDFKQ